MKIFHIIYFIFIVLLGAWQYYARKLYYNDNEKYRKRYRSLKITVHFFIVASMIIGLCHLCSCVPDKRAMLELSTPSFDFGSIMKDSIYEGNVIITNSGNVSLVIEKINPGCGCTTANLSKEIILPDDTCMLTFSYNTLNKIGKQNNFITIIANTDSLVHILEINADVY
jgi:Protein of unknown function (DUF1573).